jgi:hypothetical protein
MAHALTDLAGAARLARALASDLALYNADAIERSLRDGRPFVGLEDELLEARSLFLRRVAAGLDPVPLLVRTMQGVFGSMAAQWGLPVDGLAEAIAAGLERGRDRLALCIVDGAHEPGRIIPLGDGVQELGRTAPIDIEIAEPSIARRHARLIVDGAHVMIEDIESTGVFVNDEKVSSATLNVGVRLKLGGVGLTLIRVAAVESVVESAVESTRPIRGDLGRVMDRKAILDALGMALGRGGPLALVARARPGGHHDRLAIRARWGRQRLVRRPRYWVTPRRRRRL